MYLQYSCQLLIWTLTSATSQERNIFGFLICLCVYLAMETAIRHFQLPHRHPINRNKKICPFFPLLLLLVPKLTEYYHFCRLLQIGTVALGGNVLRL